MQPIARPQATLVDLLDRILDRGLVINADIIISLAGVPLIAVNLRATLASVETMVKYGVMREWGEDIRGQAGSADMALGMPMIPADETPVGLAGKVYGAGTGQWQEQ